MSNQTRKMKKAAKKLCPCTECDPIKQKNCVVTGNYNSCKAVNVWEADRRRNRDQRSGKRHRKDAVYDPFNIFGLGR